MRAGLVALALIAIAMWGLWVRGRRRLDQNAYVDPDTGVANMEAFEQMLEREWQRATRYQRPLGLVLLDVEQSGAGGMLLGERDARAGRGRHQQGGSRIRHGGPAGSVPLRGHLPGGAAGIGRDSCACARAEARGATPALLGGVRRARRRARPARGPGHPRSHGARRRPRRGAGARRRIRTPSTRRSHFRPRTAGSPLPERARRYGSAANRRGSFVITPVTPSECSSWIRGAWSTVHT